MSQHNPVAVPKHFGAGSHFYEWRVITLVQQARHTLDLVSSDIGGTGDSHQHSIVRDAIGAVRVVLDTASSELRNVSTPVKDAWPDDLPEYCLFATMPETEQFPKQIVSTSVVRADAALAIIEAAYQSGSFAVYDAELSSAVWCASSQLDMALQCIKRVSWVKTERSE